MISIAQPPHGALHGGALVDGDGKLLGVITAAEIRGTTVVLPATPPGTPRIRPLSGWGAPGLPWHRLPARVAAPHQREGHSLEHGLLVTAIRGKQPAASAGLLVGDVIAAFDGSVTSDPDSLVMLLRGDRIGKPVTLSVLRGVKRQEVAVTVGERLNAVVDRPEFELIELLTPREHEVLALVSTGCAIVTSPSGSESPTTRSSFTWRPFSASSAHRRAGAVRRGLQLGLIHETRHRTA